MSDADAWHDLCIQPRGALVVRDGRPFAATPGARAVSLPWPLPSTVAGALRTAIGDSLGFDWHAPGVADRARDIRSAGPLGLARWSAHDLWTVYLPAPRDALIVRDDETQPPRMTWLYPEMIPGGAGCDLPHPVLRPLAVREEAKPEPGYAWWSLDAVAAWLVAPNSIHAPPARALDHLPRESRIHVAIDAAREAAQRGALYTTEGRMFPDVSADGRPARALLCRVAGVPEAWTPEDRSHITMGGERRIAELMPAGDLWPALPPALATAFSGATRLRLILATPAIFRHGWRPGWLDGRLEGSPPGIDSMRLRLVGAAVGRREPVSGWDLEARRPKAARFMAPAGSVYFFEILDGAITGEAAERLWLRSLADEEHDRRDGFGLALPGRW